MTDADGAALLERATIVDLATVDADGEPCAVPNRYIHALGVLWVYITSDRG